MRIAITRPTGPELAQCELTYIDRIPIDISRAKLQHARYLAEVAALDVEIVELERLPSNPDAVFVEDVALVLDELALLLRPGVESRRGELGSVADGIRPFRELVALEAGTIEGGDVVVLGRTLLVARTTRTDAAGIAALRAVVAPLGYAVREVDVRGVLHLKSAATAADDETLVAAVSHVDLAGVSARVIEVPLGEPHGANVLRVGETLLADATAMGTLRRLTDAGYDVRPVDISEFAKAEGALTCKSLVFEAVGTLATEPQ